MRRVATLVVAMGLTVTGIGITGAASGAAAAPRRTAGPDRPSGRALAASPGKAGRNRAGPARTSPARTSRSKPVRFGGYAVEVPASWPVYQLNRDPSRCVRYDRHAVYLGQPGANQQCPPHLVGRVATISLAAPGSAAGPAAAGPGWQAAGGRNGPSMGSLQPGETVQQNSQEGQVRAVLRDPGLTVSATYGADAGVIGQIMRSLHRAGPATAPGPAQQPSASAQQPSAQAQQPSAQAQLPAAQAQQPPVRARQDAAVTAARPAPAVAGGRNRRRQPSPVRKGFDACTAPSLDVMRRWRPAFSATAIYLGGPNAACGYGNLSAAWVRAVVRMGWSLIPTYVGPQAPCSRFPSQIRVGRARTQGAAAARDAISLAAALGMGRHTPIYDDMEAFNDHRGICRRQVISFLNGWTRQLHARGYVSGVYSSAGSGARDLGETSMIYGERLAKPDSLWFALWDGNANLEGSPYLSASWWTGRHRIKQYRGGHRFRFNGATVNIDSDLVNGAVFR